MSNVEDKNAMFIKYAEKGDLEKLQSLYLAGKIDIGVRYDAFVQSCVCGCLEVAKWLFSLGGIDIHAQNNKVFVWSCFGGYLEIAKWVFQLHLDNCHGVCSLGIIDKHTQNIAWQNDGIFVWCCRYGYIEIVNWLCSICDTYKFVGKIGFIYLTSSKEHVKGNLEENVMNNKITLDEDILKFGMFYGRHNVVIKCLDNKIMLPTGSLKYLFTKEKSVTNKHEIWVNCEYMPEIYGNKENKEDIVKILYNYGYTLNNDDHEILKKNGIDSKEFV